MQTMNFLLLLLVLWVLLFTGVSKDLGAVNAEEISVTPDWFGGDMTSDGPGFDSAKGRTQIRDGTVGECDDKGESEEIMVHSAGVAHGRLLRRVPYYVSYGALRADRVPCAPRSGRPYYTRDCYGASGPVRPYHSSCTAITRCRRYTW